MELSKYLRILYLIVSSRLNTLCTCVPKWMSKIWNNYFVFLAHSANCVCRSNFHFCGSMAFNPIHSYDNAILFGA